MSVVAVDAHPVEGAGCVGAVKGPVAREEVVHGRFVEDVGVEGVGEQVDDGLVRRPPSRSGLFGELSRCRLEESLGAPLVDKVLEVVCGGLDVGGPRR